MGRAKVKCGKGEWGRADAEGSLLTAHGATEIGGTGLGSTVLDAQSIIGFVFSSQGIPRMMDCAPIERTKKVSRLGAPARV